MMMGLYASRTLAVALAGMIVAGCGGPGRETTAPPESRAPAPGATGEDIATVSGIPVYPGARYLERPSLERSRMAQAALTGLVTQVRVYDTDDPVGKVIDWYTDKLGIKPAVTEFDLGRLDKLRAGERGKEAHFILAPLRGGTGGSRSVSVSDRDIQLPPGGVKPGERVRLRIVDRTTIRIAEMSPAPGSHSPGEEPAR